MYGLTTKQRAIKAYLFDKKADTAANIQRGIGMKRGNVYQILRNMINKKIVTKVPGTKLYAISKHDVKANTEPVKNVVKPKMKPFVPKNPLVTVYEREIQNIQDGIDSLMITKSYLLRRVEQIKQEDARYAGA